MPKKNKSNIKRRSFIRLLNLKLGIRPGDLRIILLCFFVAATLWFVNAMSQKHSMDTYYPIQFNYNKDRYISLKTFPEKINVRVKGTGWQLLAKSLGMGEKTINYKVIRPVDRGQYLLGPQMLTEVKNSLGDIEIEAVKTDTVGLDFDRLITKEIAVKIDSQKISLAKNIRINGNIRLYPRKILVKGPSKKLQNLVEPYLLELPFKNIEQTIAEDFTPQIKEKDIKVLEGQKLGVEFNISQFQERSHESPIIKINFPDAVRLNKNNIKIQYAFKAIDFGRIRLADFKVIANYDTFNSSDSTVKLQLVGKPYFIKEEDITFAEKTKVYEKK